MARANLTAMLGRLDDEEPATAPAAVTGETPPTTTRTVTAPVRTAAPAKEKKAKRPAPRTRTEEPGETPKVVVPAPAVPRSEQPLFLRLERKEARLRADQYADLTTHARRLSQAKTRGGERITENTLIRVAIDLLLQHASDLSGETEAEIRNSVTL